MNALIPQNTLEQIVAYRDAAIAAFGEAFADIEKADASLQQARRLWKLASPRGATERGYYDSAREVKEFFNAVNLPDRDRYMRVASRLIDIDVWAHIIQLTDIEKLMDSEAHKQLRDQMAYVPERYDRDGQLVTGDEDQPGLPPVTVGNVISTLEGFAADADMIWRRGVANVFAKLDRRFRSHDGFKVGSRLVLTYMFDDSGWFTYQRHGRELLHDIERAFLVLDGKSPRDHYAGIVGIVEAERRGGHGPRQSEHEGDYFKVRAFKNGNAHLWFTRDDLVEKVNKVLAEYYGEVIGDGQTKEADPLKERKNTPAKNHGFFPTPADVASKAVSAARLYRPEGESPLTLLEPSAGTGVLARLAHEQGCKVSCVEIQSHLASGLEQEGIYQRVLNRDFLEQTPASLGTFKRVLMNPPFDRERDIDHVMHALDFLEPDGILVAIMSAGTEFRETRKSIAFRCLMENMKAKWIDLPPGSFAEVGTNVNTLMLRVAKDGRDTGWL